MTTEHDAIHAWLSDAAARARLDADVAQELRVSLAHLRDAHRWLRLPPIADAPRLQDYIGAARAALLKAFKTEQAHAARQERAYMALIRLERKARRARARARAAGRGDAPRPYMPLYLSVD
jgi:hypothetical protein